MTLFISTRRLKGEYGPPLSCSCIGLGNPLKPPTLQFEIFPNNPQIYYWMEAFLKTGDLIWKIFFIQEWALKASPSFLLLKAPPVKAITAVEYNRAEFSLKILGGFLDKIFIF